MIKAIYSAGDTILLWMPPIPLRVFPPGLRETLRQIRVVSVWAENDPSAAASWALSIPEGDARRVAFSNIVLEWAKTIQCNCRVVKTLPQGDSRDTAIVTFANNCLKDYAPSTALSGRNHQ